MEEEGDTSHSRWEQGLSRPCSACTCRCVVWMSPLTQTHGNNLHLLFICFMQMTLKIFFPRWKRKSCRLNRDCLLATSVVLCPCLCPLAEHWSPRRDVGRSWGEPHAGKWRLLVPLSAGAGASPAHAGVSSPRSCTAKPKAVSRQQRDQCCSAARWVSLREHPAAQAGRGV